ncbi:MATE family efflux transporter [Clostridium sp. UBA1056]|uniref:MATE family efflux transporter n=1 Tax=unclassified Clostridium TaxID=2614128 RepID=UPI00321641EC
MNNNNILNDNIYKTFIKYVSLNIMSMLGLSLYILADTYFVSNGVGSDGLVALNLVLPVYSIINGVGLLLGMGGATRFSISLGKNTHEKCEQIFTQVIHWGLGIGIIITIIGIFFSENIVKLLGASSSILPLANSYLKTIMCLSLGFIINNIIVCFVRNDSDPNLAMLAMLTASGSNIILDYIFIYPMKLGMFGAAFATALAPLFSMFVLSTHFLRKKNTFRLFKGPMIKNEVKPIILSGIPSFITELSSGVVILIFNMIILNLEGNMGIGAYGIISNISLVCVAIFTGIGQGIQPIISVNFGANKLENIRKTFYCALVLSITLGFAFYILGLSFDGEIISLFNKDGNAELAKIASQGISLYFLAFIIMGINIVSTSLFTSISMPKQGFVISILRGFIIIIPTVLVLSSIYKIEGVWLSMPITEAITLILCIILLKSYFRKISYKNI